MTPVAITTFPATSNTGRVTSVEPGYCVRVRRDGRKNVEVWHPDYWRKRRVLRTLAGRKT